MAGLISALRLKNFKGFSEEVRIELRPITLLFGANSAGKSSVLQALQYVFEVLSASNLDADATSHGGDVLGLGGFQNLVHGRDLSRSIEIGVEMSLGDTSMLDSEDEDDNDFDLPSQGLLRFTDLLNSFKRNANKVELRLKISWSRQREAPIVQVYEVVLNGEWCARVEASSDGRQATMKLNGSHPLFMVSQEDTGNFVTELDDIVNADDLFFDYDLPAMGKLREDSSLVSWLPDVLFALKEHGAEPAGAGFSNWMRSMDGARPKFNAIRIRSPGAREAESLYWLKQFESFLSWLLVGPAQTLRDQLTRMRYIGPLRKVPDRGTAKARVNRLIGRASLMGDWADGSAAWETLGVGSAGLRARVSSWMGDPDRLNTGYSVVIRKTQEYEIEATEAQRLIPIGPSKTKLALKDSAGLLHDPKDIGVGVSQIFPVVVAALDTGGRLVSIEQPELHVHPSVQVGLGDLFIEGAVNQGSSFLIETHSEHLILRLLRRIREAGEKSDSANDSVPLTGLVGVYYLGKSDGVVTIDEIPVTKDGEFGKPWPQGFFDERGAELF